jgi:Arc/MetJ-type ribon-helix-helix transcriptional regulator
MSRGLAKKSLVVDEAALTRWVRVGRYRNESEAVRGAVAEVLTIRGLQQAVERLRRRGAFGRHLER